MKQKPILIEVPFSVVAKLRKQAKAGDRSLTAQTRHLVITGTDVDRAHQLEVALRNIIDGSVACTGDKNRVVSTYSIKAAQKLLLPK